jgi:hypothetical protein
VNNQKGDGILRILVAGSETTIAAIRSCIASEIQPVYATSLEEAKRAIHASLNLIICGVDSDGILPLELQAYCGHSPGLHKLPFMLVNMSSSEEVGMALRHRLIVQANPIQPAGLIDFGRWSRALTVEEIRHRFMRFVSLLAR